jgi:anti-sigma regulatory factor (Ser/Thr protein kinase)
MRSPGRYGKPRLSKPERSQVWTLHRQAPSMSSMSSLSEIAPVRAGSLCVLSAARLSHESYRRLSRRARTVLCYLHGARLRWRNLPSPPHCLTSSSIDWRKRKAGAGLIPMAAMVKDAHVRLELSSRAENVPLVRQALGGFAEATGLSIADLNDIGTAVTEACNNASAHAYGGDEGPLEVELDAAETTMVVTVRDRGVGMVFDGGSPVDFPTEVDGELTGIGVPTIQGLATNVRWTKPDGGGTTVEMMFSIGLQGSERVGSGYAPSLESLAIEPGQLANTIEAGMAPFEVAHWVLPRLLRAMSARAHFSIERHADVQHLGSVLLADVSGWASSGGVQARLVAGAASLELAIGPMAADDASVLADAVCEIEPELHTSVMRLGGGKQRLVLGLERLR